MEFSLPKSLTALFAGLALSVSASATPFIAGENAELGGLEFTVDFGTFSYVSDLSQGGLRRTEATQGSQISFDPVVPAEDSNLFFDWSVFENPDFIDPNNSSFYRLAGIDTVNNILHTGGGSPNSGTVSRFIPGGQEYQLIVGTTVPSSNPDDYVLTLGPLSLDSVNPDPPVRDPEPVPDSSLGFLGIASIFGVIGASRRFGRNRSSN